jgi:hypothetical protein
MDSSGTDGEVPIYALRKLGGRSIKEEEEDGQLNDVAKQHEADAEKDNDIDIKSR